MAGLTQEIYQQIYPGWGWTEAQADWAAGHGPKKLIEYQQKLSAPAPGATTTTSAVDLAKQMYEQLQQFKQPAIQTLEAGRGQIAPMFTEQRRAYEAEKEPLTSRYQNLLADITKTTREAAGTEFTRRGIPLSSGIVESTVGQRMAPQIERVGLERETGLRDLTNLIGGLTGQEAQMGLDLNSAIAAIQSATGTDAVTAAMKLFEAQQTSQQEASRLALDRWIAEQQQKAGYWEREDETPAQRALREAQTQYYRYQAGGEGGGWTPDNIPFRMNA